MSSRLETLLALDALGLLDAAELDELAQLDPDAHAELRAELEASASMVALTAAPVVPPASLRERLLADLHREPFAPLVARVAELFDVGRARAGELLGRLASTEGWTPLFPGAAFLDLEGGPALGSASAGLVRIAAGLEFPNHRHIGAEQVLVLQGAFVDSAGARVGPGQLATMPDGSSHGFTVEPERELFYAVVVSEIEFDDGTRAP
ncbi:ChrR Cupin-like domain protein [Enhygromyxa salina]|uniref:ChrR Cupin-like domain protein n=1 Tax=Enhygromyxa salina TaxID=215803 RepID=A0A2S9Y885_9BACT|nr:cupin domain-containing protein [Enhygromyxa salina]PRQ01309.1 ChrR Cupin-like domain protein [Enhygromyxa salina]